MTVMTVMSQCVMLPRPMFSPVRTGSRISPLRFVAFGLPCIVGPFSACQRDGPIWCLTWKTSSWYTGCDRQCPEKVEGNVLMPSRLSERYAIFSFDRLTDKTEEKSILENLRFVHFVVRYVGKRSTTVSSGKTAAICKNTVKH